MGQDPALSPLSPLDAKKLAREIVENGSFEISNHAVEEMANDDLATPDCINLIRAGVYQPAEFEKGEWRYRILTQRICVVITFESNAKLRLITAWRIRKK